MGVGGNRMILTILSIIFCVINMAWFVFNHRWDKQLMAQRDALIRPSTTCYACVTEASVTSFSAKSANTFCGYHKAHWSLINDLEGQIGITVPVHESPLTVQRIVAQHYGTDVPKDLEDLQVEWNGVIYNGYGNVIR
jgi:hypothetical protein